MKALRHMIDRAIRNGADPADTNLPDEIRRAAAINNLNAASAKVRSRDGLNAVGLDEDAKLALAALKEMKDGGQTRFNSHHGVFMAIPLDLLHDAVVGVQLPNDDQAILRQLREPINGLKGIKGTAPSEERYISDRRLAARLQMCTIKLMREAVEFHNSIPGFDICATSPALHHESELHNSDISFTFRFHILSELFDHSLNGQHFNWSNVANKQQLVFFHYVAREKTLTIIYGDTCLNISVDPMPAPETTLANLALDAPRRTFDTVSLIEGLDWVLRWAGNFDVLQEAGAVISTNHVRPMSFSTPNIDRERIAIPAIVAPTLKRILRRLGAGAFIRDDGNHYFIEKGVFTLAFAIAPPYHSDFQNIHARINKNGIFLTLDAVAMLRALLLMRVIEADRARMELIPGNPAHIKLSAVRYRNGKEDRAVDYFPVVDFANPDAIVNRSVEFDVLPWIDILSSREAKVIKIIISGDRTGVSIEQEHEERVVHALAMITPTLPDDHEWDRMPTGGSACNASGLSNVPAVAERLADL